MKLACVLLCLFLGIGIVKSDGEQSFLHLQVSTDRLYANRWNLTLYLSKLAEILAGFDYEYRLSLADDADVRVGLSGDALGAPVSEWGSTSMLHLSIRTKRLEETISTFLVTELAGISWLLSQDNFVQNHEDAAYLTAIVGFYSLGECALAENLRSDVDPQWFTSTFLFYAGNCHLYQGEFSSAIVNYRDALAASEPHPNFQAFVKINLAWTLHAAGNTDEAITLMNELVEDVPVEGARVFFLTKRSQLLALAARYDEAIADMDAAIALAPDDPALYVERGQRIILLYEWDRALADYDHTLELDPDYADAYFYRGVLYASVPAAGAARAQAVADFERYLALAPDGEHAEEARRALAALTDAEE